MQKTKKRQESTYQTILNDTKYLGMNSQNALDAIDPGQSQFIQNFDIYSGSESDFLKSRKGSQYLRKAISPVKRGSTAIASQITWDIGSEEYLITQEGTAMYAQALLTTGNPTAIALATGGAFALGSSTSSDLFLSGDKLYVMHPSANYVIRWTGSVFVAYPMGLAYPYISAVTSANAGAITGSYTLGIEKVYQVSGVDAMASTPNRKMPTTRILAVTGTISAKKIKVTLQATELDNDSLWTHLRFWRSKNKNTDITDPLNPIDAQGIDDELYEEALITKAEIGAGALASIATGSTLPPGNAGTQAGKPGGVYTIEVNNADSVLFNLIGIDRIELVPIPACTIGCFCANRIFFSGVQDSALDDASKNNIWYSNYAGTKYAFQYNPLNFVDTGRDGQNMIKLLAFEKDVIGIKEAKTGRLPSGNVDLPYQGLDDRIGIKDKSLAAFIPGIGIAAIVNDLSEVRIFGYDLRWTSQFNGMDISKPVRNYTSGAITTSVSFAYINGKLMIHLGIYNMLVLHVKEGRGWTLNHYLLSTSAKVFTFAQNSRAALVGPQNHLIEIEVSGLDTDIDPDADTYGYFSCVETTRQFRSNEGRDIIEHEYLSIDGSSGSTQTISAVPYVNNVAWPDGVGAFYVFTPSPSVSGAYNSLTYREYRLYIPPSTIGTLKWCPCAGNFIHYYISMSSPCVLRSKRLHCIVDENGMAWGAFDPYQQFPTTNTDPTWAQ